MVTMMRVKARVAFAVPLVVVLVASVLLVGGAPSTPAAAVPDICDIFPYWPGCP